MCAMEAPIDSDQLYRRGLSAPHDFPCYGNDIFFLCVDMNFVCWFISKGGGVGCGGVWGVWGGVCVCVCVWGGGGGGVWQNNCLDRFSVWYVACNEIESRLDNALSVRHSIKIIIHSQIERCFI